MSYPGAVFKIENIIYAKDLGLKTTMKRIIKERSLSLLRFYIINLKRVIDLKHKKLQGFRFIDSDGNVF